MDFKVKYKQWIYESCELNPDLESEAAQYFVDYPDEVWLNGNLVLLTNYSLMPVSIELTIFHSLKSFKTIFDAVSCIYPASSAGRS